MTIPSGQREEEIDRRIVKGFDNYRGIVNQHIEKGIVIVNQNYKRRLSWSAEKKQAGCCGSGHTRRCCMASGAIGLLLAVLGLLLLVGGEAFLDKKILASMALAPESSRLASWLVPPVQAHLEGYGFHLQNPEAVMRGEKPIVKEIGPFVYKAVTIKDSVNKSNGESNLVYGEDGKTLTYRPRKFYFLDRSKSVGDPDTTFLTVPNVPLLTAFDKIRNMNWLTKPIGKNMIMAQGRGTPFINVSFSGLLWGYEDEMPCMKLYKPEECYAAEAEAASEAPVEEDVDDGWGDDDAEDDGWGDDDDWKRKKRSVESRSARWTRETHQESPIGPHDDLRTLDHDANTFEKGGFLDCKCNWGLFRDRNVTLRKSKKIHHGMDDLAKKGWIEEFDGKKTLDWWVPGSKCDEVGGQDASTLPPLWTRDMTYDFYTPLMCRRIKLFYEKDTEHAGLQTYRFIPDIKQLASHTDPDPAVRNPENACYCKDGFRCLRSGAFNMAPCKVKPDLATGAPLALSYPHFYMADPWYLNSVEGLKPEKEKHEFYVDIAPKFGFPLAIRPKFQLNAIIERDTDIEVMSQFQEEPLVLPFLWAQDGFSEPSEEMAHKIATGLKVPGLATPAGAFFLVLGLIMLASTLAWSTWARRAGGAGGAETYPLS